MSLISKKLRVFMTVVNHGSISKASQELSLTISPVSRMISELEGYLKIKLFNRTGKGLSPTDEGFNLYNRLLPLYAEMTNIEASIRLGKKANTDIISVYYDWGNEPLVIQMQSSIKDSKDQNRFIFHSFENKMELMKSVSGVNNIIITSSNMEINDNNIFAQTFTDPIKVVYDQKNTISSINRKIILCHKQKMNPAIMRAALYLRSSMDINDFTVVGCSDMMHEMILEGQGMSIVPNKFSHLPSWKDVKFDDIFNEHPYNLKTNLFHSLSGRNEKLVRSILDKVT